MADLTGFQITWIVAGAIVFVGWLIISFSAPGKNRTILEWVCATAMYIGLETLFVSLLMRAHEADNHFAVIAFGFLCALFGGGLLVSTWNLITSFGGEKSGHVNATH